MMELAKTYEPKEVEDKLYKVDGKRILSCKDRS